MFFHIINILVVWLVASISFRMWSITSSNYYFSHCIIFHYFFVHWKYKYESDQLKYRFGLIFVNAVCFIIQQMFQNKIAFVSVYKYRTWPNETTDSIYHLKMSINRNLSFNGFQMKQKSLMLLMLSTFANGTRITNITENFQFLNFLYFSSQNGWQYWQSRITYSSPWISMIPQFIERKARRSVVTRNYYV